MPGTGMELRVQGFPLSTFQFPIDSYFKTSFSGAGNLPPLRCLLQLERSLDFKGLAAHQASVEQPTASMMLLQYGLP